MLFILVMIVAMALIMALFMSSFMNKEVEKYSAEQRYEQIKKEQFENTSIKNRLDYKEKLNNIEIKSPIINKDLGPIVNQENLTAPKTPQINNYNFENIGKSILTLCGVLALIFGIKYLIRLFKYIEIIRRFNKHEKRTNKLLNKLKICFEDRKEFLLLADSIEHQLKLNDLLLKSTDAEKYGVQLEVADDYLYDEYHFINDNLLNQLK